MTIIKSKHLIKKNLIILFLILLANCQLQESKKLHGINYLENRKNILEVNKSNKTAIYYITITNQENMEIAHFKGTVYRTDRKWFDN